MSDTLPFDLPEQVLHSLGEGITFADREGRIVFSNEAADRILGVPATQAPADEWADHFGVFLPDHRTTPFPTDRYPLVRALKGEETAGVEMWIRNPENPAGALISVTGRPLRDDHGRITGAAVVFRDITAEREAQEELERANTRLEEVQRQKDELSAFLVHDLKSPITGILLGSELLMESGVVEGDELQALRDIRDAAGTLHCMVLDLLDIRQAEDAGLKPELAPVPMDGLLREVAQALGPRARATGVTMTVADGMGDLAVRADPDLLQRVIRNLADNSLKYAPGGNVRMGARPDGPSVVLVYVADDGPGVPEELRPRIFEIWTQAERTGEGRHRDSRGVGLHFCRLAVEAHGGRIRIEDSEAGGARFCVELPQAEGPSPTDGGS